MAALPLPKYGLSNLYLFPIYDTRDAYTKATGQECPAYDPSRPPKAWFDPNALNAPANKRYIVYDRVVAYDEHGVPKVGQDGKPYLEDLVLSRQEAGTVNIAKKEAANEPGTDGIEVPVPLRELEPEEELSLDFGNVVTIHNRNYFEAIQTGFTSADRVLLQSIAKKLNVPIS